METLPLELIPYIIPDPNAIYYLRAVNKHMHTVVPRGVVTKSRDDVIFAAGTREFLLKCDDDHIFAQSRVGDAPFTTDVVGGRAFDGGIVPRHVYFDYRAFVLDGTGWERVRMQAHRVHNRTVPVKTTGSMEKFLQISRRSECGACIVVIICECITIYSVSIGDIDEASAQLHCEHHVYIESTRVDFCARRRKKMNLRSSNALCTRLG